MMGIDTQFIQESAREGANGVWKIIWWNILAFAARLLAGVWLAIVFAGGWIAYRVSPVLGWIVGLALLVLLPLGYGMLEVSRR